MARRLTHIAAAAALLVSALAAQATTLPLVADINGARQEVFATEVSPGRWQISAADAKRFGATDAATGNVLLEDVSVNINAMTMSAQLPLAIMPGQQLRGSRDRGELLKQQWGAWANYTLDARQTQSGLSTGAIVDLNVSLPGGGMLRSIHAGGAGQAGRRLQTSYTLDDPEKLTTLTIGDGYSSSYGGLSGYRFAGVQLRKNYSLNPYFVYWPTARFSGSAKAASTYEIFEGNRLAGGGTVGRGDYTLDEYSSFLGASGTVKLVIKDALGHEQVITRDLYVAPGALKSGETSYGLDAGKLYKDGGGLRNGFYASGSIRHGFDRLTVEAGFDKRAGDHSLTLGAVLPTDFGDFSLRKTGGQRDGQSLSMASVGWSKTVWDVAGGETRVWANTESNQSLVRQIGASWWAKDLSLMGSAGQIDGKSMATLAVSKTWGQVNASVSVSKSSATGATLGLAVSMPLGAKTQGYATATKGDAKVGGFGEVGEWRWSAAAGTGGAAANVRREWGHADTEFYVQAPKHGSAESRVRVLGSVVAADGGIALARPVTGSLLLVETGVEGVPVRSGGRSHDVTIGSKTVVTNTPSFASGTVQPDFDLLPPGYTSGIDSRTVRAPRGVSSTAFDVRTPGFLLGLTYHGKPVERGVELQVDDGKGAEPVVMSSAGAYVQPRAGVKAVTVSGGGCAARIDVPAEALVRVETELCK